MTQRHVRPEVLYQRQRQSPDRLNNSPRRTYDLLRSTLVTAGRSMRLVEHELTDALSASRNTIRAVLQQLAREGLVTREPKNGTRATGSLLLPIDELSPFAARTLERRSLGCPPIVRDRLRLPPGLLLKVETSPYPSLKRRQRSLLMRPIWRSVMILMILRRWTVERTFYLPWI